MEDPVEVGEYARREIFRFPAGNVDENVGAPQGDCDSHLWPGPAEVGHDYLQVWEALADFIQQLRLAVLDLRVPEAGGARMEEDWDAGLLAKVVDGEHQLPVVEVDRVGAAVDLQAAHPEGLDRPLQLTERRTSCVGIDTCEGDEPVAGLGRGLSDRIVPDGVVLDNRLTR